MDTELLGDFTTVTLINVQSRFIVAKIWTCIMQLFVSSFAGHFHPSRNHHRLRELLRKRWIWAPTYCSSERGEVNAAAMISVVPHLKIPRMLEQVCARASLLLLDL